MASQGTLTLEIKFSRPNKTYCQNDVVSGVVLVSSKNEAKHEGVHFEMLGAVQMQLAGKVVGVFESLSGSSAKPIQLSGWASELVKAGKVQSGKTEIPFEFVLEPKLNRTLYETYHGVFIAVQYVVKAELKRSFPAKTVSKQAEFLVEYTKEQQKELWMDKPVAFTITPESVQNKERNTLPKFNVTGKLDSCSCVLNRPLTGEVTIHRSEQPLKSMEIQLIRVETCGSADGCSRDATEIQTLQIAEGDVLKGVPVPIYMVLPRLFTCPTTETPNFKIEFEMNLVVLFANDHLVNENFPLTFHRY